LTLRVKQRIEESFEMFKKFLAIYFTISLLQIIYSQQGWYQLTSGTSYNLRSVCFLDINTGYAVGFNGTVLKTTNGGLNWISQPLGTSEDIYDIHFIGQTGYIVGGTQTIPIIFKTTNGGMSWQSQTVTLTYHLHSVFLTDSENAHAVSDAGKIIRTTNGGTNWTVQTNNPDYNLNKVFFVNANTGFIVGTYRLHIGSGILLRTDNGGNSWSVLNNNEWRSIYFINSETGYGTVGGTVRKSTNGGTNWINQTTGSYSLTSIWFANPATGYTAGSSSNNSVILKTTNSGVNWNLQAVPSVNVLNTLFFMDASTGYAAGNSGTILKTTNGGVTALMPLSNEIPEEYKLYQNYPNPFNPNSKIRFQISKLSNVKLIVFDILGRETVTIVNEELKPGTYEAEFSGEAYPSGIYFYRLLAEGFNETLKMSLVK
jgi:photosystem II stability/assembly factor-like uncharacterized protein